MTFISYLRRIGMTEDLHGPEGVVYAIISSCRPDITYREASLIFADLSVIRDAFESLWSGYESELDRQNYEREHSEPVPVSVIIDEVVADLRKRCSSEAGND